MSKEKWNDGQLRAINNHGAVIVSASAGSGKTTVMIERVLKAIIDGSDIERLLVVTFTNAAALDMKDKLSRAIAEKITEYADEPDKAARLIGQLSSISSSKVCTLHSFCLELVRRFYYLIGLAGEMSIMNEGQAKTLAFEIIGKMAEDKLYSEEVFTDLYISLSVGQEDRAFKEIVWELYSYAVKEEFPELWLDNAAKIYSEPERARDYNIGWMERRRKIIDAKLTEYRFNAQAADYETASRAVAVVETALLSGVRDRMPQKKKNTSGDEEDLLAKVKTLYDEVKSYLEDCDEYLAIGDLSISKKHSECLTAFVKEFMQLFGRAKAELGQLEFCDAEHYAYKLLKEHVTAVRNEYTAVFVDEYQDISPIQDSLIAALVKEGNSFFVGDIKQSIYRFRLCCPEIFAGRWESVRESDRQNAIPLNYNYRSNERVLDFCNAVFAGTMTGDFGGTDYEGGAMLKAGLDADRQPSFSGVRMIAADKEADADCDKETPTRVYSVAEHEFIDGEMKRREFEAEICSQQIAGMLGSPYFDGKTNRQLEYRDFAVLTRSNAQIESIVSTLKKYGIPCRAEKKNKTVDKNKSELARLNNFVRIIDNYRQDIPLISVMRSSIYGFTDEELIAIRKAYPHEDYFYKCALRLTQEEKASGVGEFSAGLVSRLKGLFTDLKRYGTLSHTLTCAELMSIIAEEKDYFKLVAGEAGGEEKQRSLERYLAYLEEQKMPLGIAVFLEWLDKGDIEGYAPPAVSLGGNFVRVMTVHGSKGLEFPIVLLTELGHQVAGRARNGNIFADRELGVGIRILDADAGEKLGNIVLSTIRRKAAALGAEEELRLLYVALTRAQSGLILIGANADINAAELRSKLPVSERKTVFDWVYPALVKSGIAIESADKAELEAAAVRGSRPIIPAKDALLESLIGSELSFDYKYGHAHITKTNVTALTEAEGGRVFYRDPLDSAEQDGFYEADRALTAGNAYHKFMELYDFESQPLAFLDKISGRLTEGERACIDPIRIDRLRADKEFARIVKGASRIYREKKFVLNLPACEIFPGGGDDCVLIQGVIDFLAVTKEGRAIIVDYKTTRAGKDDLIRLYSTQLRLYSEAVSRILGIAVEASYIYSFYSDSLICVENNGQK